VKPVAAGCQQTAAGLRNDDALLLQQAMSLPLPYEQINPVALEPAIAPHIAAEQAGKRLQVDRLAGFCRGVLMQKADFTVIEGAGGWRVPLNPRETLASLAVELQLPVILVVGMKLGCISHALLTAEAIARDGLKLAGWVANNPGERMACYEDNLNSLKALLPAPCIGEVPFLQPANGAAAASFLDLDTLV
jgi:dethiobiotin synthetase